MSERSHIMLFFEPPDGGVAENVLQLALGMGDHGWTATVVGPEESSIRPALGQAGIEYIPLAGLSRGFSRPDRDLRAVAKLSALLRRRRPTVLHCHSSKAGVVGRLAARLSGVPVVYSPHCFGFVGDVSTSRRIMALGIERALRRLTRAIICVCEQERREALRHRLVPASAARLVFYGVPDCDDCNGSGHVDADLLSFKGDSLLFGAVTVLRDQKRVDILLRAIPRVLAEVPDSRAVVVGDGPLRDSLDAQARDLGLYDSGRFAFLPFSRPSSRFLRALDVFVLPSAWEALPIGLLEAMACGTPQVATAIGGTPEAVTPETGTLVPPDNVGAIATAVIELLRNRSRREAGVEASRRRHADLFGLPRMVRETARVYADVAGQRSPRTIS